jgi:hypothetical protein
MVSESVLDLAAHNIINIYALYLKSEIVCINDL